MSALSNTRVLHHPQEARGVSFTVNGRTYTTDGSGALQHVLEADVAALNALVAFSPTPVRDAIKPVSPHGKG